MHCHDTGLAAYLMGIRDAAHLSNHSARAVRKLRGLRTVQAPLHPRTGPASGAAYPATTPPPRAFAKSMKARKAEGT